MKLLDDIDLKEENPLENHKVGKILHKTGKPAMRETDARYFMNSSWYFKILLSENKSYTIYYKSKLLDA